MKLKESIQFGNLHYEIEARWRLVETAWSLNTSRNIIKINHDEEENLFYVETDKIKRIGITSAHDALNGYQKGKCFYCFSDISIESKSDNLADVDHFFPHTLRILDTTSYSSDINGIWNLVLACSKCNRGENGNLQGIPKIKYLEGLHTRNSFLINSHHPLLETLINQTGINENERRSFYKRNIILLKIY